MSKTEKDKSTTPDGGWGWMVAIGCAIIMFLTPMPAMCFSILFSGFLLDNQVSSTTIAWIYNANSLTWNLTGPFVGPLMKEFGFRKLCLTGAVMISVSIFACAFTNSTVYLLVFFSMAGLFGGLTAKPCHLLIAMYFDKHRGMANAINMAGLCAGQFVGPLLIRFLLRNYGFTGATIIVSSIIFNCCVGASLFQPVEWHLKDTPSSENCISQPNSSNKPLNQELVSLTGEKDSKFLPENKRNFQKDLPLNNKAILQKRIRQESECSNSSSVAMSMIDLSGISYQPKKEANLPSEPFQKLPVRVIRSLISDLRILRYHRAKIISFGSLFLANGYLNFLMVVPFAIQNAGYTPEDAAWCVSITGACNFIIRLSASILSDYSWFNMKIMYVIGAVIVTTCTAVFSFLSDLTLMKVTLSVWAIGIGINISLFPLVIARVMGIENMPAIYGTQSLVVGIGNVALGPLIGYIRDVSNSYAVSMRVMSAEVCLCVILWCFMPAAIRRDLKKDSLQDKIEDNIP